MTDPLVLTARTELASVAETVTFGIYCTFCMSRTTVARWESSVHYSTHQKIVIDARDGDAGELRLPNKDPRLQSRTLPKRSENLTWKNEVSTFKGSSCEMSKPLREKMIPGAKNISRKQLRAL